MTCPAPLQLSQAFPNNATEELRLHLLACPSCAATWRAMAQVRTAAQELPFVTPDKGQREAVRRRLLEAAASLPTAVRRPHRPRWVAATLLAAAMLAVVLGGRLWVKRTDGGIAASHWRAVIQAKAGASFVHDRTGGDEWVRLSDGTLHIEVQPLQPGERFRVLCGDSEIEVRGTAFETVVDQDHLQSVYVLHGSVEVRLYGGATSLLGPGERWQASSRTGHQPGDAGSRAGSAGSGAETPPLSAAPSPAPAVVAASMVPGLDPARPSAVKAPERPVQRPAPSMARPQTQGKLAAPAGIGSRHEPSVAAPPKAAISAAELAFMDGWAALRQGHHQSAAVSFARAAALGEGAAHAPVLEDSRFWRAVALARAGQRPAAVQALREFLGRHPGAARFGEAKAILGWQLLQDGLLDEAQQCFEAAEKDPHAPIRENARSGLAAVTTQRQRSAAGVPSH